jgi:outer membrane PBP1 activator LpoA protein
MHLSVLPFVVMLLLTLLVAGCGSTGKLSSTLPKQLDQVQINPEQNSSVSAPSVKYLNEALKAEQTGALNTLYEKILAASKVYFSNDDCAATHAVLAPLFTAEHFTHLNQEQQAQASFYRAVCAHPEDSIAKRIELLNLPTQQVELLQQQWLNKALLFEALLDIPNAIYAYVKSERYGLERVWDLTQSLPSSELNKTDEPRVNAFVDLALILREHGLKPFALANALTYWQYQYAGHPLVEELPKEIPLLLANEQNNTAVNVTVLLPLSGRLSARAEQIKQGILASYFALGNEHILSFADTNGIDSLAMQATIADADVIIGPLLKENVEMVLPLIKPQQQLLALNRVNSEPILALDNTSINKQPDEISGLLTALDEPKTAPAETYFFALAPEDEATQIAEQMFRDQYQQPILIHADDSIATRMANAFSERWSALQTDNRLLTLKFTDNKSLRKTITEVLGVAASKQRANKIERYLGGELFSVTRNRRDIDAFVVFANAKQTELINPMIESSISSFSNDILPVYATSRSYNHKLNKNSLRDLQNVNFIDIPWLLHNQDYPLYATHDMLFPTASTTDKRLFAFGHDAYSLLFSAHKLAQVPGLVYSGLTGDLYINSQKTVARHMPKATIKNQQIITSGSSE